ncbi:hypothetical protein Ancab_003955 [Ancistrocladus abbreviatus]
MAKQDGTSLSECTDHKQAAGSQQAVSLAKLTSSSLSWAIGLNTGGLSQSSIAQRPQLKLPSNRPAAPLSQARRTVS